MPKGIPHKEQKESQAERVLAAENATLRQQLAAASGRAPLEVKYKTSNMEEASNYLNVGGRVVTVTSLYPNNPKKAGKVIGFAETKQELDELVQKAKELGT